MKRLLLVLLALFIFSVQGYAGEEGSQILGDYWYEMSLMGQKMGYLHQTVAKTKYQGADCYKYTEESLSKRKDDVGNIQESRDVTVYYTDMGFAPLYSIKKEQDGSQKESAEIIISGDKITIKETLNDDAPKVTTIPFEPGVIFGVDGLLLKRRGLLKVGTDASFRTISAKTKKLATETIKILREEKIKSMGQEVASYFALSSSSDMPGLVMNINMDTEGTLLAAESAGLKVVMTTERKAKKFKTIETLSSFIKTNINVPFTGRITRMEMSITLNEEFEDVIPSNEYQQAVGGKSKKQYEVTLNSVPLDIKKGPALPVSDEALKKYLEPTLRAQSADPMIVQLAKEIVKNEKDSLKAARLISGWIYKNIKKEYSITASKSAKETLTGKSGDCSEHTVLFCALARAAGVPTRNIGGIMYLQGIFGYHAWNEVYLGKWVPVDSTLDRVGIPAVYIKLGEDEEGEESVLTGTRVIKMIGKTAIKIKSFTDNAGVAVDLSAPGNYIARKDRDYTHLLYGIKITAPEGWEIGEGQNDEIIMSSTSPAGNAVIIMPLDMYETLTPQLFNSCLKGATSRFTKVETQPVRESDFNGQLTMDCTYTGNTKGSSLKNRLMIKQANGKTFMIAFSSLADKFEDAEKDFQTILDNMEF
jgi:hypothetical protein